MVIPFYPAKANSARSNSDTQSLNEYNNRRHSSQRKVRQSIDLTRSIDCNNNGPLKPRDQNELVGEAIQYPAASKMREMLATDSSMPMEKTNAVVIDAGNRSTMKRASQVSFASRLSTQAQPSLHNEAYVGKTSTGSQPSAAVIITSARRTQQSRPMSMIQRRGNQSKQVSFMDRTEREKLSPKTVTLVESEESQPLALTTKNLHMYNAMILKTIRTSKFDERIVKWVKERQCDQKSRIPSHDVIPEVDETSYSETHGRITPNKRDHTGGKTPRESERTIHITSPTVYQSADTSHSAGQSGQALGADNVKFMKPTSLDTTKAAVEFSYSVDKHKDKSGNNEKLSDQMSAKTDSNNKTAEMPAT